MRRSSLSFSKSGVSQGGRRIVSIACVAMRWKRSGRGVVAFKCCCAVADVGGRTPTSSEFICFIGKHCCLVVVQRRAAEIAACCSCVIVVVCVVCVVFCVLG